MTVQVGAFYCGLIAYEAILALWNTMREEATKAACFDSAFQRAYDSSARRTT